ncbi:MAG: DUF421 domain-containing protein [Turicibacter sp.]
MDHILATIIKGIPIYFLALLLSRTVGKKIITKMNFFDFVMGVSMGSMIANAVIDKDHPVVSEVTALTLFTMLTVGISYLSTKSNWFRKVMNSEPVVVIDHGIIIDKSLKQLRMTLNELMMKLREKDVFNFETVEYAIMERDGKLSVLVKADKKTLTPYDMNLEAKSDGLLRDIIIDGNIIEKNLAIVGVDRKWVEAKLKSKQIHDVTEVFYAGIDGNKKLKLSKKCSDEFELKDRYGVE